MRPSSSWNSPHISGAPLHAPNRTRHVLSALWLLFLSIAACSSPPTIPPYFESFERIPIKTVTVHHQRIAYLDVGTGPPVILIHGFGGSMWQWEHQQQALAQDFRVLTVDLLGSGLSDKPDIEYRPDQLLDFFVGFMDAVQIPHATLVGNSMGAGLAIGMALEHPTRVSKLVLIGGLPPQILLKLTSPSMKRALESRAPSWVVSFGNWLFGGFVTESVLRELVHDPILLTPAVIERSNRNRRRPGLITPIMAARNTLPLWETGFATRLHTLSHPTMIIWGEQDRVFPRSVGEELHHTIPGSQFVPIAEAGHLPQWEQPDLVNSLLIGYIHSPANADHSTP
ncbi:MAG: alpha/beta fold hydrolase [Nitrospira sp.]|nr:alpha/beta fold hydrolase [Nitrospira sp.]